MSPRKSVKASARSVEKAIAQALSELGVERDEADIEIIREGNRGVLGFGAEDAEVVVSAEVPASIGEDLGGLEDPEEEIAPEGPVSAIQEESRPKGAPSEEEIAEVAREVLATLLEKMGMSASVVVTKGNSVSGEARSSPTMLDIKGRDLGILIGRRGETLRDLQFMTRLIVNRRLGYWPNIVVDVEGYKVRREEMLTGLALRMADKAVETQRTVILEPMSPYERRIIHIALSNHPQVTTESTGEGESRKVTILPRT